MQRTIAHQMSHAGTSCNRRHDINKVILIGNLSFAKRDLLDIHFLLINGLLGDQSAVGALRSVVVKFDDSKYLPPDNPHQLKEIFDEFCEKANAIGNLYEQALFTMVFISYVPRISSRVITETKYAGKLSDLIVARSIFSSLFVAQSLFVPIKLISDGRATAEALLYSLLKRSSTPVC